MLKRKKKSMPKKVPHNSQLLMFRVRALEKLKTTRERFQTRKKSSNKKKKRLINLESSCKMKIKPRRI